jgi:hypothetical protein
LTSSNNGQVKGDGVRSQIGTTGAVKESIDQVEGKEGLRRGGVDEGLKEGGRERGRRVRRDICVCVIMPSQSLSSLPPSGPPSLPPSLPPSYL